MGLRVTNIRKRDSKVRFELCLSSNLREVGCMLFAAKKNGVNGPSTLSHLKQTKNCNKGSLVWKKAP